MPIVIGLGQDEWKDPLNLYAGKAPETPKVDTSSASSRVSSAAKPTFSDSDRSALVDTIIAEAAGEGSDGMKAVAAVIKNRSDRRGKSPLDIVKEPDQFTGYAKPGEGALKAMKDPVLRKEAEDALEGVFSGSIADPTGGADHYHADYVNPSWASKMQETTKIGRHLFYTSGGQGAPKPASTQSAFAPGIGIDNDEEAPFKAVMTPQADTSWLRYANQDATRSRPLDQKLVGALGFLPDLGVSMEVFSGGQPTKAEGGPRTGSDRHDHGGAADVFFYKDGRRLDWANPQDVPLFQEIVRRGKENGITGFGAGDGYMRPGSMHIGFGKAAVWGAGGKGANAPSWLRTAYASEPTAGTTMADAAPKGLVSPGNIDLTKRPVVKNDDGTISTVRSMSFEENGKEILVPTVSPDGRLLSQADAIDLYHKTGQHLGVFDNASDATSYAQSLHAQQEKLYAKASATAGAKPIVVDSNFKPQDPMGLFGAQNPFNVGIGGETVDPAQQQEQASAQAEQNRMNAYNEQHNATIGRQQQLLEASDPGRYTTVSEDELNNWTQQWKKDNQSTGMAGDVYRMGKSGTANLARSADNLSRMLLNRVPLAGPALNSLNDAIDKWAFGGKTRGEMLQRVAEKADASVSDAQLAADNKRWTQTTEYTDAQGNPRKTISMGDAWRDPRSYLGMAVRSAPETIATMAPAGLMARGAYVTAIASGMAEREAAAASAKTATLAGSALEGAFGGSDSALNVRDQIAKLPPEVLQSSAAYKSAIAGGMTPEQAVKSISDDAETQAFILSGVATGMFGGMGDRALAKIISEGVSGGIVRRSVTGAVKGVVSEGVLEEMPQSALGQVAENKAMQTADPRVKLSDNVVEQAVGGLVGGSLMGSAFGGVGGAASHADEHTPAQPEPGAAPSPIIPAAPAPKGPLGRAVQHAEEQTVKRTQRDASEAIAGMPVKGATVRVDHEGVEPFMGRVEGHDGDEVVVFDSHSGEVFQVPRSSVTQIADSPENIQAAMPKDTGPAPINDSLPDFSADPALEPAAPIAGQTTSEPIPERSGTMPALDRLQGRPQPGQRVIVDDGKSNRFSARIQSYEEGRTEALVKNDAGEELQVPVSTLHVDKSTPKQVESEELKRNPPVERELGDAGPNSRKTFGKTVVFPDEDHAALYDLAKDRAIAKKLGGAAYSDLDRVSTDEVNRLAAKFKVGPQDLISMADDYRYRADDAGREARSALPVNMHGVNARLLRQAQNKLAKANGADAPAADDLSHWWDVELTQVGRRNVLEAAGVKRPDKVMWEHLTPKIREKLAGFRVDESGAVAPSADTVAENADSVDAPADTIDTSADTVDEAAANPDSLGDGTAAAGESEIDKAAHEAATSPHNDRPEPTQAQKEAGNYKVGKISLGGMNISIENPKGSARKGVDANGKPWSVKMQSHYGYILGTVGKDKDHIDVFVKPGTDTLIDSSPVFVVDQRSANNKFDEHKVMLGFATEAEARKAYLVNYTKGWRGLGDITETTLGSFKGWLAEGNTSKPFAPKWFTTAEKAQAYIAKNGMQATHQVEERNRRFEIWPVEQREDPMPEFEHEDGEAPAPKAGDALAKVADAIREIVAGNEEGVAYGLRPDLAAFGGNADVHFVFGNAKAGLAHIGAKRSPEVLGRVLKAVALGTELQFVPAKKTVRIVHDGVTAVLSLDEHGKTKSWLLTGWENGRPDAKGEVGTQSPATQTAPTFSRDDLVAGLDTIIPSADTESKVEQKGGDDASSSPPLDAGSGARADTATAEPLDAIASQGTGTAENVAPKTGSVEVQAARPKTKLPKLVDRLENYFRPGRRIPSYGGTDEVISFNRLGDGRWDVTVAEVKGDGSLERPRNHATAPDDRDLKKWERANPVGEFSGTASSSELPNLATAPEPAPAADTAKQFANNKVFTADAVEAARARLKAKMSQLNSGIDPEMMMDGMTIAGAYIESGVRNFADYASRMTADFGDGIKPYLLSFWEGARNWPNIDTKGMTTADESRRLHAELVKVLPASEAAALGAELKVPKRAPRKGRPEDRLLEGDYGVDHIDGYADDHDGRETGSNLKDAFLKDASGYLKAAADKLVSLGYVPVSDEKGRPLKPVSVNQAGDAVSGEASLHMVNPETGVYVYANVQGGSLRNAVPTSPSGIYTLFRASTETYGAGLKKGSSGNLYAPLGITAGQLADLLHKAAGGVLVQEDFTRQHMPDPSKKENGNELAKLDTGSSVALAGVPAEAVPDAAGSRAARQGSDERSRANSDRGERVRNGGDLFGGSLSNGAGELSLPASGGNPAAAQRGAVASDDASGSQRRADDQHSVNEPTFAQHEGVKSAAVPAQNLPVDYTITDADALGAGGQKAKYKANVDAIRILRTLSDENRPATRQEQTALAKWVGWGGLQAAFTRDDGTVAKGWEREAAELQQLLTPEEYKAAQSSTRNAHYTSPEIVNAVWQIARRLGFKGGQVLEPSVGAGNFLGLMPGDVKGAAQITGVELDHITGSIAKNLYPTANIQAPMGFEKLVVPDDHFDLAIGNPPFGSEKLYDKQRRALNKLSIHNFFFAKSVAALRPGGVLAMVVTNRFLDGNNAAAREMIGKTADLIGAIRLPNNAFLKNAGTEVTTDIIVLRKRMDGDVPNGNWGDVVQWTDAAGKVVPLNQYFVDHPEMMLGDFGAHGSMYGPDEPALIARAGQDLVKDLDRAIKSLPMDIMAEPGQLQTETVKVPETVNDVAVGTAFLSPDGKVHVRKADSLGRPQSEAVELDGLPLERVSGMLKVRDAFAKLRRAQIDDKATNAQVEMLRAQLNREYDAFVKKHGPINSDVNKRLLRDDPTWPQLAALEDGFDKGLSAKVAAKTGEQARAPTAKKAAIFSKRTQQPYRRPDSAANAKDALATTLNELGRVDMAAMSRLYGKSEDDIVSELGALIYKTPAGGYETADAYLSGNVRQKLAEAERAAADDVEMRRNVTALRAVIPDDIEAIDIDVKAGSPWIPPSHIADFIRHINQNSAKPEVFYSAANAKWQLRIPSSTPAADAQWATSRVTVSEVINAALNQSALSVTEPDGKGGRQLNQEATDAANEKVARVKEEWARWIWQDDTRREQLARLYNDTFNTDVLRTYDGSHLTLPGKVGDDVIALRPHQKNFIWRSLQTSTSLADHVVGAGKTFALIASIMEKRRIGQAKKPMLTVPNHLVGQWAADFIKLYPGAKILAATKNDFETANRKQLFARVATGDWDCVIVAHSSFGKIGVSPEIEMKFIQQQMDDLESSITALRSATGEKGRNAKQLTKWRDTLKAKMEKLLDAGKKDEGLTFDELGVDALYVDEAHEFKNLAYSTSMTRVAGLGNQTGSQKAADLYMKSRVILERTGGNNLVFATGTPISNTMAEMYTVQRYLDEKALKAQGLAHFDAWARVFGEVVTDWELAPSGKYKLNTRFRRFVNIPELLQRYRSFADVITNDDIKAQLAAQGKTLPLPKVKGGKPENVAVERSPDQAKYIGVAKASENGGEEYPQGSLVYRAEHLPKKAEKGADNMLKVMSDARKAALDMRLIDPSYGDYAGSKVHVAADNIKRIFDRTEGDKGTQLVFIDLSTPKKAAAKEAAKIRELVAKAEDGDEAAQEKLDNMSPDEFLALESSFSVYDDLRQKLLDRGIPENQIAFIHDANTDLQKEELFGKVRSGAVRILFGSTPKMGAGTNVQNRLVALHHLDAPWRPSDLEQRDGRGIRQGNELYAKDPDNFEIEILRYATKQTLDARQWQGIEAKATFIQQIRKGNMKDRTIEDVGGEASNAAEMKAEASGNPLILEEMELNRKLKQMQAKATEHDREQHRIKRTIGALQAENAAIEQRLPAVEADAAAAAALDDKPFAVEFRGKTFEKPSEFGAELLAAMRKEITDPSAETPTGSYGDFELGFERTGSKEFTIVIGGAKEHHVVVDDVANADSTGTAMRIVNTVKKLAKLPATDKARMADNADQIPKLSGQLVEWGKADELSDLAARHRRVLDALKPKANAAVNTATAVDPVTDAASYDPPKANKRPDPIERSPNNMRQLDHPKIDRSMPIGPQVADLVRTKGKATGHEHLIAIDDDGSIVEYGTAGQVNSTGLSDRLAGAWMNPDRKIVAYHNHPSSTPLSTQDIGNLGYPGLHAVWAIGHDGHDTRAELNQAARDFFAKHEVPQDQRVRMIDRASRAAEARIWAHMMPIARKTNMSITDSSNLLTAAVNVTMHQAGIIDFSSNRDYNFGTMDGLDAVMDKATRQAQELFYGRDRSPSPRRYDRRAITLRHIADVASAPARHQSDAGVGPKPTGLAETGNRSYSGEEGRAGQIRERALDEIKGKLTDIQPALLKTIPLNYFTELAQPGMTAVGEYLRVKRLMDAYRGDKHAAADKLAQDWLKYTRNGFMGKDRARAQELADLMHDSTIAGIDPSSTEDEEKKKGGYEALRRRYMALPPKGKELYAHVRDSYREQADELDKILLDNVRKAQQIAANRAEERYKQKLEQIKASGLTGLDLRQAEEDAASRHRAESTKSSWAAKARLTKMRIAFESSRVEAPYFPLGRFGRYFVTLRDLDGTIMSFSKFETAAARDRFARDLRSSSPGMRVDVGVMERGDDIRKAMDPRIVAEIQEILGGAGVDESVMDQIWQRYLDSMPDLSTRKRFIHRKGTEGYNRDALRVYSSHMFHASHQMARAKFGLELQELVGQAMDQARETDDATKGVTLANELGARHKWVMNPTGSKVAQIMTSTAFVWYLAASPASAILNMTQTPMMGMPVLAGRFGSMTKAATALLNASYDSLKGKGSVADANLTRDEKKAMEAFYSSGLIDRTQSHDLAGAGETGVEYSPARARVMGAFSWAFHRAEVWNREVTALAAYRMARDAGQDMAEAIDTAHDLTWRSHFDYSNSSRPSILQNDVAKVALVFRQYNINMLYRLFRDMHQSVKGASPQLRREARYQLAGITGMMALIAGVSGTVGFHLAMALAGIVFGDDDDPMDFEQQFRADVVDILGPQLGGVVLDGVPGHYLGVDLTSRIGMPDLWFRSPNRELQGKEEYQYWLSQTLGATTGIGEAIFTGANVALDGDVARGIEMAAPKFVRDLMKSYRYATDGLQSFDGDEILSADSMGPQDLLAQAMGFTPARVSETWERNNALKGAEHKVVAQRQQLVNAFAMAAIAHDEDAVKEALDDIRTFNAVPLHFGVAIKKETLERSLKTRASNRAKREDGVLIRDKILNARLRAELADRINE